MLKAGGFRDDIAGLDFNLALNAVCKAIDSRRGLLLTGACGCGKTHLMRVLYNRFSFGGQKYWVNCNSPDDNWVLDVRQNKRIREMYGMYVFLDDLGTEVRVEYGQRTDFISEFIREYHNRGSRRLFVTTNLDAAGLCSLYDERIVDRLMEMCVVAKFNGTSHREKVVVK